MFRGRKWRIAGVVVVLWLVVAAWARVWPFAHGGGNGGGHCDPNERFVVDETGKRFLEARWPLGREDNLVWLRIPAEYVNWASTGCISAFGPGYPDPDVVGPYDTTLSLEVVLPEFAPKNRNKPDLRFLQGPEWSSVSILVHTLVRVPVTEKGHIMEIHMHDTEDIFLNSKSSTAKEYNITYGPKPDRFGLKRIGALEDLSRFRTEFGGDVGEDIYFPDHQPPDMWIRCQSEEIKDYTEDPSWDLRTPPCEHHFYSQALDADVEMDYRRIYLPRWREWQEKTEAFLRSLPMVKAGPRTH